MTAPPSRAGVAADLIRALPTGATYTVRQRFLCCDCVRARGGEAPWFREPSGKRGEVADDTSRRIAALGRIAIIERGDCQFETDAFNALAAGAIGAVIVNSGDCAAGPPSSDCVLPLGCGDLGVAVTLPTVMISQADGAPLLAARRSGRDVRLSFGGQPTRRSSLKGQLFQSSVSASDPNPADNELQLEILLDPLPAVGPVRRRPAGRVGG